ncbi:MAG: hypothetical protein EOP07_06270 [Proteobacteria bacterium]|nr:MAG: hypothetical protein EOP07_06270 [Pseudomonadota bacterium]
MKLYVVHCGFYDASDAAAIYENHANHYITAESFEDAKAQVKGLKQFRNKHMHIDGIQELVAVNGYRLTLTKDSMLEGKTQLYNLKYGSRAPQLFEQDLTHPN